MNASISRAAIVAAAAVSLLAGLIGPYASVAQGSPGSAGRIAFISARDGDYDVYVRAANGALTGPLWDTDSGQYAGASEYDPEWSPDGTQLAFSSNKDGDFEIFLMNPDGSGVRRLTDNGVLDRDPTWSPDGNSIVFATSDNPTYGNEDLSIIRRDPLSASGWSAPETLLSRAGSDRTPEFSPDGTKVAFACDGQSDRWNICVMDSNGTNATWLFGVGIQDDVLPTWSPDGSKIAFTSTRSGRSATKTTASGLWIMNADGSSPRRITPDNNMEHYPDWGPNANEIAVQTHSSKNGFEVSVHDLTTGRLTTVATSKAFDGMPDW